MLHLRWAHVRLAVIVAVGCLAAAGVAVAATHHAKKKAAAVWTLPNFNRQNTRDVPSKINASNVTKLKEAWSVPLIGGFSATPVFSPDGKTVYLQDLDSSVWAVDTATGSVDWKWPAPKSGANGEGPNGVTLVGGKLYGETKNKAFALSAATGHLLWMSGKLAPHKGQGFNEAPLVDKGVMYVSNSGDSVGGHFYALKASTGKILWKFSETKDASNPNVCGSGCGGGWGTPLMGPNGTLYIGTANPYRSVAQGIEHPSNELYDDSTVALNPHTGKIKWYMQAVPNDFFDWDMNISPMWSNSGPDGQPTVIDGGKMGYVYAMNADTGKVYWKTSVGLHSGADQYPSLALQGKLSLSQFKFPYRYCPSDIGGPEESMALAGNIVYIATSKGCSVFANKNAQFGAGGATEHPLRPKGNVEALDLKTGKVLWNTTVAHSAYGAATVTNNLVFTTTYTGRLVAFNRMNGKIVWNHQMPAGSNSAPSIDGNLLVVAAGAQIKNGQKSQVVAYKLP